MEARRIDPTSIRVIIRAPGDGGWGVSFRAKVRKNIFLLGSRHTINVRIRDLAIAVSLALRFDVGGMPQLIASDTRVELRSFKVRASNWILNALGFLIGPLLEETVEYIACKALPEGIPTAEDFQRLADYKLADTAPVFNGPAPDLTALQAAAEAVSGRIQSLHTPLGSVFDATVARDRPNGPALDYAHYGDSAIWSGHYLAAEAFRFAVTSSDDAAAHAERTLNALEVLVNLAGKPGLLSRVAVPLGSPIHASLEHETVRDGQLDRYFQDEWQGTTYQSLGHITRDQYAGALLGAGVAAMLFKNRPAIAAKARTLALSMIDYLISRNFCPEEATPDPTTGSAFTSVTYLTNPAQVLAILQLANHLEPGKYASIFARHLDLSGINWFFNWLQTVNPVDSYYKFNLEHVAGFLTLWLGKDANQKAALAAALRVLRSALKFHANPWFNLVELATLGDQPHSLSRPKSELENETKQLIAASFDRPPLMEAPALDSDPAIEKIEFRAFDEDDTDPGQRIARLPVPVQQRPGTDFLWQRPPFALEPTWPLPEGNLAWRSPGVDQILPYWMARWLGL